MKNKSDIKFRHEFRYCKRKKIEYRKRKEIFPYDDVSSFRMLLIVYIPSCQVQLYSPVLNV